MMSDMSECKVCQKPINLDEDTYFEVILYVGGYESGPSTYFCGTTCMDNYRCFLWGDPHEPPEPKEEYE